MENTNDHHQPEASCEPVVDAQSVDCKSALVSCMAATASNHRQSSAYETVVGANDQELARRQYSPGSSSPSSPSAPSSEDSSGDQEDDCAHSKRKRPAIDESDESPNRKRAIDQFVAATNQTPPSRQRRLSGQSDDENHAPTKAHMVGDDGEQALVNGRHSQDNDVVKGEHRLSVCALNGAGVGGKGDKESVARKESVSPIEQDALDKSSAEVVTPLVVGHSEEPEQLRKLFIGGLDYKTSEETLRQHFEKFGNVIDCVVMREPQTKRSRGFGFVIYANSSMVDRAQETRPHEVDGREVQSKRAISREDSGKPEAQATVKKVYLGGLSDDVEESELRDYFKEFGNIVNINIVAHKDTGKRRGFAFVEYDDYDPVDKIVLKKFHTIKDKRIEAKKAIPKVEMDARKRVDPRASMAGTMIALSGAPIDGPGGRPRGSSSRNGPGGGAGACLWDGGGPYGAGGYPSSGGYSPHGGAIGLDGYSAHYHAGPPPHYATGGAWMMHGATASSGNPPYGFGRSSHGTGAYAGRNSYAPNLDSGWNDRPEYVGFTASQGAAGPMRLGYQHRGWCPYGNGYNGGGTYRGRGYNS